MSDGRILFEGVSKKFRRGERHTSLRDLVPALARGLFRRKAGEELSEAEFWAVRDVSFEVRSGEALGIIGPNGAGKSTILKLLTRILKPTVGRCEVRGRVGALIEVAAGFHQDLTGRENVYLQGAIMGMKRREITARFDEIVEFAGVGGFMDTPVKRYSSGMNARLGFAIAAHLDASVLLIDEVLSVGDMEFQRRCVARMLEIKRQGAAIAFVSHDLAAVRTMCERALLLESGSPVLLDETGVVVERYLSGRRRSTVGGELNELSTKSSLELRGTRLPPGASLLALKPGDELALDLAIVPECAIERLVLVVRIVQQKTEAMAHNSNHALAPLAGAARDGELRLDVALRLNLLRGIYDLSISVCDAPTQRHLVWLKPAATFGIDELESFGGVAHLDVRLAPHAAPCTDAPGEKHGH